MKRAMFDGRKITSAYLLAACTALGWASNPARAQNKNAAANAPSATSADSGSSSAFTPRTADDHPDLNGRWSTGIVDLTVNGSRASLIRLGTNVRPKSGPPYKPELAAKVADLNANEVTEDPNFLCHPPGVPRLGPPQMIVQAPGVVALLYDYSNGLLFGNWTRVVPTDGRPHRKDADASTMGDSVGHWEGDTLVVDVTNFDDSTWLGTDGWFHSTDMHVVERFTRNDDTLSYQVTVEDPNVFTKPWIVDPVTLKLDTDPADAYTEEPACVEKDESHMVGRQHLH